MALDSPAQAGNRVAIESYLPLARKIAKRIASGLGDAVELEDVISDAYLGLVIAARAFEYREREYGPGDTPSFSGYASLGIHSGIRRYIRTDMKFRWGPKCGRQQRLIPLDAPPRGGREARIEALVDSASRDADFELGARLDLEAAIHSLDERQQHVVRSVYFENKTQQLIARELALPPWRVGDIAWRALVQLRRRLRELEER
jgi:RNA polymerase sigma factor (sigma-70 family)